MKLDIESTKKLLDYIKSNEVVYQTYGGLIEVANDSNIDNRSELIDFINQADCVEVYYKDDTFIQEPFEDLNNWATKDDVFFLLQIAGVLICIPKKEALDNLLMAA